MSAPTLTEFSMTSDVPGTESAPTHIVAEQSKTAGNTAIPNGTTTTTSAATAPAPTPTTEPPSDTSSVNAEEGRPSSAAPSVSVVLSAPKTTEELIAARALKRAARRQAIREKAEGHKSAGDYLVSVKNYKAAYPQYLEAIQLWGSNPTYFISLAECYRKLKWYEEAAHAATRALTLDPKNTEARYVRGVARLEQRLLKPAKIDFETVLSQDSLHLLSRAALTEVNAFIAASTQLGSHDLAPSPIDEATKDIDFGFPPLDYEGMEADELSDSSDCNHVGNGIQCRFYNHDGCARGSECQFSHAPDEKSVRDELGKNVCIYYLLDACKFGAAKCIYSHSKAALPKKGWWNNPEQVVKVKSVLEAAEKQSREQRQIENEKWRAHVKAMRAASKEKGKEGKEGAAKVPKTPRTPRSAGPRRSGKKEGEKADEEKKADGEAKEANGEAAAPTQPTEPPKSAGIAPKSAGLKKRNGPPRRRPQPKKDAKSGETSTPPSATLPKEGAPSEKAPTNGDAPKPAEGGEPKEGSGFTDYQLNAVPNDVKPDTSVTLNY
ncbi:hypothetical protein CVT26_001866 [Gymnopilus dilepis]|uniref:C3H1-type domain-containing protein n=1 Tax=Gymnopilus dilepis TaxID=231916 RepID=A0A409Y3W2_9AGAR|nr:hypothetical protein CVT26_001866 [Gymnopilus dilepis]